MCGIAGVVGELRQSERASMLEAMGRSLVHRGPDGGGTFLDANVGLVSRRLSIVDIEGGHQPLFNEDRSVVCIVNGEIYNYPELRAGLESKGHRFRSRTDVEVVVHLYEDFGVDFVDQLRGMFALALWDTRTRSLVLARDGFGIKPLVYAELDGRLYFGSEAKAVLASGAIRAELDPAAVSDLIYANFTISPHTMFRGIHKLPAGHVLIRRNGHSTLRKYWEPTFPHETELRRSREGRIARVRCAKDWAEELHQRLRESVRRHLQSDVPVGVLLSGGIDSSAILALAASQSAHRLTAYSLGYEESSYDEFDAQGTLQGDPRWDNVLERCTRDYLHALPEAVYYNERPAAGIELVRTLFSRAIQARGCKVVLSGEGADELLGGYRWYHGTVVYSAVRGWPVWARRLLASGPISHFRPRFAQLLRAPAEMGMERYLALIESADSNRLRQLLRPELTVDAHMPELVPPAPTWLPNWEPFAQLHYYDQRVRLGNFIIDTLDTSFMSSSVEVRVPFLDRDVAALAAGIPSWAKMRGLTEKQVLREAMRDVLPNEIRLREKRGMLSPVAAWLKQPLPDAIESLLQPAAVEDAGIFRPQSVLAALREHRTGQRCHGATLWKVVWLQLWHEIFVRGRDWRSLAGSIPGSGAT